MTTILHETAKSIINQDNNLSFFVASPRVSLSKGNDHNIKYDNIYENNGEDLGDIHIITFRAYLFQRLVYALTIWRVLHSYLSTKHKYSSLGVVYVVL